MLAGSRARWPGCLRRGRCGLWSQSQSTWWGSRDAGSAPDTHTAADCTEGEDDKHNNTPEKTTTIQEVISSNEAIQNN